MAVVYVLKIVLLLTVTVCNAGVYERLARENHTEKENDDAINDDLGPPDHLDAVKFERDGHINPHFHHEIFLGEEKHHFEEETHEKQQEKLRAIFQKADINEDAMVDENELENWIMRMVSEHMQQAMKDSEEKFAFVGGDEKGVTYEKFYATFMDNMRKKNASHGGKFTEKYITDRLTMVKKEWRQADLNNDTILSREEFLFFQHPELSDRTLAIAVQDFLDERDFDMNKMLDLKEFVFGFPIGDIDIQEYMDGDELLKDKVYQFNKLVDVDGNGFADFDEMKVYLNPFSKVNSRNDAHDMIFFVDMDDDKKLSFMEVMLASEYLTGTKLYDASSYFHNEL